jgi:hypothetical protein
MSDSITMLHISVAVRNAVSFAHIYLTPLHLRLKDKETQPDEAFPGHPMQSDCHETLYPGDPRAGQEVVRLP